MTNKLVPKRWEANGQQKGGKRTKVYRTWAHILDAVTLELITANAEIERLRK